MTASLLILYSVLFIGLYFQVFLLLTFIEKPRQKTSSKKVHLPTVTITVPCFNEEATLVATIESLRSLNYPKDKLDILIVDDGSTDNTFTLAQSLAAQYPEVRAFKQANGGKFTALNFALTLSKADLVGCLDADSFVDSEALIRMIPYFEDQTIMAVTPAIRVHNPKNVLQKMQKAEYNLGIFSKNMFAQLDAIYVTPGPFSIFRKKVFDTIGGYKHAHNTEDMEMALRMQSHGLRIANCPHAYVYTVTPNTVKKLYKQRLRWTYGFLKNSLDYRYLFFRKKFGNIGAIVLPFAVFSVFSSLYMVGLAIINFIRVGVDKIVQINTVGLSFPSLAPHFDLFFVGTEAVQILTVTLFTFLIFMLLAGKKLAEGTFKPAIDIIYFICFYGFIAPLWVGKALYNTILSKATSWR